MNTKLGLSFFLIISGATIAAQKDSSISEGLQVVTENPERAQQLIDQVESDPVACAVLHRKWDEKRKEEKKEKKLWRRAFRWSKKVTRRKDELSEQEKHDESSDDSHAKKDSDFFYSGPVRSEGDELINKKQQEDSKNLDRTKSLNNLFNLSLSEVEKLISTDTISVDSFSEPEEDEELTNLPPNSQEHELSNQEKDNLIAMHESLKKWRKESSI